MADRLTQRLIAAGASPERAAAFTKQFAATRPGVKGKALEDAFDKELASLSLDVYPNVFRPPSIDDPRIDDYIKGVYGADKYNQLIAKAYDTGAPNYIKVARSITPAEANDLNSITSLDKYIVRQIGNGIPYAELVNDIFGNRSDLIGDLTEGRVADTVTKYYNEYNKAQESIPTSKQKFLESDKYYKAGLPDPKLRYGMGENLAEGVIDFATHPSAEVKPKLQLPGESGPSPIAARAARVQPGTPGREAINAPMEQFKTDVFNKLTATGASPFKDEVTRREYLKGRRVK
jgi:hypothetical protein